MSQSVQLSFSEKDLLCLEELTRDSDYIHDKIVKSLKKINSVSFLKEEIELCFDYLGKTFGEYALNRKWTRKRNYEALAE